jgi:hypothetical protein
MPTLIRALSLPRTRSRSTVFGSAGASPLGHGLMRRLFRYREIFAS